MYDSVELLIERLSLVSVYKRDMSLFLGYKSPQILRNTIVRMPQ
jgi:hypothetical protein